MNEANPMPCIIVTVGGLDSVMSGEKVKQSILQLLRKGRCAGIHLIAVADDVSDIPEELLINFPARIIVGGGAREKRCRLLRNIGTEKMPVEGELLYCHPFEKAGHPLYIRMA